MSPIFDECIIMHMSKPYLEFEHVIKRGSLNSPVSLRMDSTVIFVYKAIFRKFFSLVK